MSQSNVSILFNITKNSKDISEYTLCNWAWQIIQMKLKKRKATSKKYP